MLVRLDILPAAIEREDREMRWHQIAPTMSRRVLGSMNDFAFMADAYIRDDGPDADLDDVAARSNRAPCRPINYESPDRATQAAFRGVS